METTSFLRKGINRTAWRFRFNNFYVIPCDGCKQYQIARTDTLSGAASLAAVMQMLVSAAEDGKF